MTPRRLLPTLLLLIFVGGCVDDPDLAEGAQASTSDVRVEGEACPASPAEGQADIEATYGEASAEAAAGLSCWREYDRDMDRCDRLSRTCDQLRPIDRPRCRQQVADCRHNARRWYWACVWYRSWSWVCGRSDDDTDEWGWPSGWGG